jgi:cell division protein FtsB
VVAKESVAILTFSQLWSKLTSMNMITVLLGATGLLLVVAVALSFGAMNNHTDKAEVARLKAEIAALQVQEQQLAAPGALLTLHPTPLALAPAAPVGLDSSGSPAPNPAPFAVPPNNDDVPPIGDEAAIAKLEQEIRDADQKFAELALKTEGVELENKVLKQEQDLISNPTIKADRKNRARASTIRAALLQARVVQWAEDGFAVIDVHRDDLQVGTILAIRRQTGIYGQLVVDKLYPEEGQAIANPVKGTFPTGGKPDVQPGDDLIIPPL